MVKKRLIKVLAFARAVAEKWRKDDVTRLAAALTFFAVLSLSPLLIIATAIVGFVFGEGEAREALALRAGAVVGPQGAEVVRTVLRNAARPGSSIPAALFGFVTLLYSASSVFIQLQRALDEIWDVAKDPEAGLKRTLKNRLFAASLVLVLGGLLLVSPLLSLPGVQRALGGAGGGALEALLSFVLFTFVFAAIFKVVPSASIHLRDVAIGAAVTSLLFTLGRTLMGRFLGGSVTTVYGAAGSLMALLLWIFVSALILFLGAEFTQVYARVRGASVKPYDYAVTHQEELQKRRERVEAYLGEVGDETRASNDTNPRRDASRDG